MARYLPFLINLALSIYALISCIQTRDEDVPHLPKLFWIVLIVLVPFVGPITWILMSRSHLRRQEVGGRPGGSAGTGGLGSAGGPGTAGRGAPPRRVAPDDDPEFLAWLDRNRPKDPPPAAPPASGKPKPDPGKPEAGKPDAEGPDRADESGPGTA